MSSEDNSSAIQDVFVIDRGGIPYVARCYGGEYCKNQPDHALLTGFFSALDTFGRELGQDALKEVHFDKLSLLYDSDSELMIVLSLSPDSNIDDFSDVAKEIREKFSTDFSENIKNSYISSEDVDEFIVWIDSLVGPGAGDLTPLLQEKPGFKDRIRKMLPF